MQSVAQKVLPSVVSITVEAGNSGDTGSGSIISEDGTIITNNHVIAGAANGGKISVTLNDGTTYSADIVARDPETDIAVIKAQGASGLTPISLGDSSKLEVGQEVVAVGSPLGLDATVTSGIISAQNRPVQASSESSDQSTLIDAIQTDAAINPGNSGGALVDMDGNLIGIPSVIASLGSSAMSQGSGSIGLGFAIPISQARDIAEQLIKNGKVQHPVIGVQVAKESTAHGAAIVDVPSDSDAAKAGLKRGDVVTKVDGRTIDSG
ncbi:trypsin-like peptidase domain-containing protein, partial [Klebsiella pneumoniae]|uniref:trypsin-like peptidase domain-containing protein n=1 Tax=Klebsiella pneumoniae TaxID=573 RepID=UPI00197A8787